MGMLYSLYVSIRDAFCACFGLDNKRTDDSDDEEFYKFMNEMKAGVSCPVLCVLLIKKGTYIYI